MGISAFLALDSKLEFPARLVAALRSTDILHNRIVKCASEILNVQ